MLDTDVAALLPLARRFLDWWGGELAEMARPLLRERGRGAAGLVAVPDGRGGYALVRGGETAGAADPARPVRAALALRREEALARGVPTPGLSERDWRRALINDIDRLTPFQADAVYVALRFETGADGVRRAELAAALRPAADAALRRAASGGVIPTALLAAGSDGAPIDLLPAVRAAGGFGGAGGGAARPWWWAVAALVLLNVGAAVWSDVRDTRRLQALVDQQQPVVERLQRLKARVTREAARRQGLLAVRAAASPLRVLDAATRALPDGAWMQRLSLEGGAVRLTGYHRPGLDVAAALQASPAFTEVRTTSADLTAAPAVGGAAPAGEPFDLLAAVRPPAAARATASAPTRPR